MTELLTRLREAAARKWPDADNQRHSLFGQAADEIERLRQVIVNAHDRLLRGDSDQELLAMLDAAWKTVAMTAGDA